MFYPLVITFLLPFVLGIFLYGSALFLHIYKLRHHLRDIYSRRDLWDGARHSLAAFWDAHGKIWHGKWVVWVNLVKPIYSNLKIFMTKCFLGTYVFHGVTNQINILVV